MEFPMAAVLLAPARKIADLARRAGVWLELKLYGISATELFCPSCSVYYHPIDYPTHVGH